MEEKTHKMKIFTRGKAVVYDGREYLVDHVTVRGMGLFVYLQGMRYPVHEDDLYCEPTVFYLKRK